MRKNFPDKVRETVSHNKPKKRAFASHDIAKERVMNVLGPTPTPAPQQKVSKFHPTGLKTMFVYWIRLKMDQKGHEIDQKGLKYMKRGFWTKNNWFSQFFLAVFWVPPPPPKQKYVCLTKLTAWGVTICIWKNQETFEIIQKIGSHLENRDRFEIIREIGSYLEKSGQFWNHPENWQSSGKLRTVLKSSGKLAVIWKNPDSFEIIRKIGCHLEKFGSF